MDCFYPSRKYIKKAVLLLGFCYVFLAGLMAQGLLPTKGTDFWFAFPHFPNAASFNKRFDVFITSDVSTSGQITIPGQGWSQSFTVTANQTTTITVPSIEAENVNSDAVENRGVHLTTQQPVSVFSICIQSYSSDGTQVFPTPSLGTTYCIGSYQGLIAADSLCSQLLIAATEDGTQVRITPRATTMGGHIAGVPFIVNLNQGETYQLIAATETGDLTGTLLEATDTSGACRPFAVFSGTGCTNVPGNCFSCDILFDQAIATPFWGKSYYAAPYSFATQYTLRILAQQNGTSYTVNGGAPQLLNAGQFAETNSITTATCIQANKPISVIQYMEGSSCAVNGDPSMTYLNSEEQKIDNVTFSTVSSMVITQHLVSVVMRTPYINQLTLDGLPVSGSSFTPFPFCNNYSYANLNLAQGSHTLDADSGFAAYVYGTGSAESYAYSAGSYNKIQPVQIDSVFCNSDTMVLGKSGMYFNQWWSTANDLTTNIHTGPTLTIYPPIVPQVYVLHADEMLSGCEKLFYFNVESPVPPVVDALAAASTVCQYQPVQLQAAVNPAGNYQYTWSPATVLNNPYSANPIATPAYSSWYKVAVTTASQCAGTVYDSVYVTVSNGNVASFKTIASDTVICIDDSSHLGALLEKVIFKDDFNSGINNALWSQVSGGAAGSPCGSVSGNALYFNGAGARIAATNNLNVLNGGTIRFYLKIANGTAPCEDVDLGEDIVLEYSTNNGTSWSLISTYYESVYPNFTFITVPITGGALTSATRFRWRQLSNSGANQDNWMLDDIVIGGIDNSGFSFTWWPASTLSAANIINPTAKPTVTTVYHCQITDAATGCVYEDSIRINVGQNFTLNTTADTLLCAFVPVQLNAVPVQAGTYTYQWNNAQDLNSAVISSPVATPVVPTTYHVTVVSSYGCVKTDSVFVNVGSVISFNALPDADTVCVGQSAAADVIISNTCNLAGTTCGGPSNILTLGNASATSGIAAITPYYGGLKSAKRQFLITAQELQAAGFASGLITSLSFNINSVNGSGSYQNYTIKMGCTQLQALTTNFVSGLLQVFNPKTIAPVTGINTYAFDTYYNWDGTSNIIIEICHESNAAPPTASVYYSTVGQSQTYILGSSPQCSVASGSLSNNRPDIQLGFCSAPLSNFTYSWAPAPLVSNAAIKNPLLSPSANTTFTVTATDANTGCIYTDSIKLTTAPDFLLNAGADTILCAASGVPLQLTSTVGAGATYQWQPANSLSNSTVANPTATPLTTTTYVVTVASTAGCVKTDSVKVTLVSHAYFNALPDGKQLCLGDSVQADVVKANSCGTNGTACTNTDSITIAPGNTVSTAVSITPFCGSYISSKRQLLFKASELLATGISPGATISGLQFNVANVTGSGVYQNFTIKMGCASLAAFDTTFVTGLFNVFTAKPVQISNGWKYFPFDNTYDWDGYSDVVIELCYQNSGSGSNAAVTYHTTLYNSCIYTTSAAVGVCNAASGSVVAYRPNIRLTYCSTPVANLIYNWSPSALVSNPAIKSPYLRPLTDTTFSLLATDTLTGCRFADTVPVQVIDAITVNAGNDTVVCSALGLQLQATASANGALYSWQPAANLNAANTATPIITANTTQQYVVFVADTSGCSSVSDTINVTVNAANVTVSNDTVLCPGDTAQLMATGGLNYLWSPTQNISDNSIANPLVWPQTSQKFAVVVTDSVGCVTTDSVQLTLLSVPVVELGNDTSFCAGSAVTFTVGPVGGQYLWQDNSTANAFTTDTVGLYWVQLTHQCGVLSDTVRVLQLYPLPVINLGAGGQICNIPLIEFDAGNPGSAYLWSTGETSQTINPLASGNYSVTVTTADSCRETAAVSIELVYLPQIDLGNDTTLCDGEELTLSANGLQGGYDWQDGSTTQQYTVQQEGLYWLHAYNTCGSVTDSIQIAYVNCDCRIYMPNAFTPNSDGNNDIYKPEANCDLRFVELKIFNRWGEKVFESNSINIGWDGNYKGKPMPAAVYTYVLTYAGKDGRSLRTDNLKGTLTLIR
ncbi:MAG: gliding motility-associated C-terminal domain-containing protein [Chitinophagales bacterium]